MEKTNTDLGTVATVGLDLAKHVFQVHAVNAAGRVVVICASYSSSALTRFSSTANAAAMRCDVGLIA